MDLSEHLAFAHAHGLLVLNDSGGLVHCPMAAKPMPLPREAFESAVALAPLFGRLVEKICRDPEWLRAALVETAKGDPFTGRLFDLWERVRNSPEKQPIRLGILRSDYMLHEGGGILQVELNTIASSFGCLSSRVSSMHRFLYPEKKCPLNQAIDALPDALAKAHHAYMDAREKRPCSVKVLFVVQPNEKNSIDQRLLEYGLYHRHGIRVTRKTFSELAVDIVQEQPALMLRDGSEISVVYFRAGYSPDDYSGERDWNTRMRLETSFAIKCPTVEYQLVGTKKIQQVLSGEGVVERFLSPEDAARVRQTFAGLYPAEEAIAIVRNDPQGFVLKPQREGGGNNIYGGDVLPAMEAMSEEDLKAFVVMQRIRPPISKAWHVRAGIVKEEDSIGEIGIFTTSLFHPEKEMLNCDAGFILRTKSAGSDEGGVAAGFAYLTSPELLLS
eukprot:g241.t1